ncbi:MAG: VPLPA-CTERM sorting domain-containing protein, partial [Syntrophales bacterium]
MKKNKMFISFMAAVLLFAFTQMAMAYTVTTGPSYGPYQTGSGGEFTLTTSADLAWVLNGYANSTKDQYAGHNPSFQTFCLEENEYINTNTTYNVTIDNGAIKGGLGGGNPDPISKGTAYLYFQFAQGTLVVYNYGPLAADRDPSAALLQQAIWVLEQEAGNPGQGVNAFLDSVVLGYAGATYADKLAAARADNNNGFYPVYALNLTFNGVDAQSQLVVTPIPAAVWLLGTGLLGLVGIRRRFKE